MTASVPTELGPTLAVVFAALPALATAVMTYLLVLIKGQIAKHGDTLDKMKQTGESTQNQMQSLQEHTNGIKDALVTLTAKSSFAEGLKQGKEEGK